MLKKKIWASFQRNLELFTQKFVTKLSQRWVWDPGSEIRDPEKNLFRIPDPGPGVKKAPDPGSGSATLLPLQFLHVHFSHMTVRLSVLSIFLSVTLSLRQSCASVSLSYLKEDRLFSSFPLFLV